MHAVHHHGYPVSIALVEFRRLFDRLRFGEQVADVGDTMSQSGVLHAAAAARIRDYGGHFVMGDHVHGVGFGVEYIVLHISIILLRVIFFFVVAVFIVHDAANNGINGLLLLVAQGVKDLADRFVAFFRLLGGGLFLLLFHLVCVFELVRHVNYLHYFACIDLRLVLRGIGSAVCVHHHAVDKRAWVCPGQH